jgi:cupin fold WbuC family metalloprotein
MALIPLTKVNDEVFVAQDSIVRIGKEEISFLKQRALHNMRKRARICAHRSNDDRLHEMVIAISASSYIRPHRHMGKSESFHIVEGVVDVVFFSDEGRINDVIQLGDAESGLNFFYRLSESLFHTLLIRSDVLVMHEVTNGPLVREQTIVAPFAPPEEDAAAASAYVREVNRAVAARESLNGRNNAS